MTRLHSKCTVCGSDKLTKTIRGLVTCNTCMHLFKPEYWEEIQYNNYKSSAHQVITEEHRKRAIKIAQARFNIMTKFMTKKAKILEIGSGHKYFLDIAKQAGHEIEGTELSKLMIKDIPEHKIHYGNPTEIPELTSYDAICGFHVVEHLNEPVKELTHLYTKLNKDGILVIEVPYLGLFSNQIQLDGIYEAGHTQYFHQVTLMLALENAGFKVVFQQSFWDGINIPATLVCCVRNVDFDDKIFMKVLRAIEYVE